MLTRVMQGKRPRRVAPAAVAAGVIIAGTLLASGVLAVVPDTTPVSVIVPDKTQSSSPQTLGPSGATVEYIGSSAQNQASGTGLFDPFVRIQGSASTAPSEKGYNTNGTVQFDTKTGTWTHAILASAIPQVDCDGSGPGTARCWELFNDINENNTAKYISLTRVEIWFTSNANLTGYNASTHSFAAGAASLQYLYNGEIKIHDVNQGSGRGDLKLLVPVIAFSPTDYFVLYSEWGSTDAAPDGNNFLSDGGFEEWKVRKTPNINITKVANPAGPVSAGSNIGFDVTISNTGAADATNVVISDALPAGAGTDLNWSLSPAFTGCSITGAVGSQTLTCTFATLAAGTSKGPIHITSGTTKNDCAVISNTAIITADNADGGQATATVTVQCPNVSVVKTANPSGSVSAGSDIGFDITISNAGPGNATNVTLSDTLPAGKGGDLNWALTPPFSGCSISGAVGSQSLSCTFASLASGGSIGPFHIQSPTTQDDCALVSNTATVASGNDGGGSSTDSVTVNCAAIVILKESTKSGNPLVKNAGAQFCYGTATGCTVTNVTDNGTGDEDSTTGSICVGGLAPGTYYVNETGAPSGYGSATQTDVAIVATQGTNCTSNVPTGTGVGTFTNSPLTDIQVNFRDGGSKETTGTISCDNSSGSTDTTPASGWDTSTTVTGVDAPTVVTCTITIDP